MDQMETTLMKRLATLAAMALLVPQAPAFAAEPYDATTMAAGGTYLTRSVDVNSPYWNPANLANTRGVVYLGGNMGFLLGNNTLGVKDVWDAMQPMPFGLPGLPVASAPSGQFGEFITYINEIRAYRSGIEKAIKEGLQPAEPPTSVNLPIPDEFNLFMRGDLGIFGLNVAWGGEKASKKSFFDEKEQKEVTVETPERPNERGFAVRSYVRAPGVDFFITAPSLISALDNVNRLDRDMALELIALNKDIQENAMDFSKLKARIETIKSKLDEGLAPLTGAEGNTLTLGANEGAYLTNAFSYQMPLSDLEFARPLLASRSVMVGATVKLHTGSAAFGMKNPLSSFLNGPFPGVENSLPGRLELVNKFNLKGPADQFKTALDQFAENPAGASALTDAAGQLLNGVSADFVSHTAGPVGVSLDFGTTVPLGYGFTAGAVLQNAPTFWPGKKITYNSAGVASGSVAFSKAAEVDENFNFTEPLGLRVGAGWEQTSRLGGVGFSAEVGEVLDGPSTRYFIGTPSLHLGTYGHLFNIVYGRLGTQIGGKGSLASAGMGLNFGVARLDLSAGTDFTFRSVGFGTSLSVGI